jgi:hypothetical protein
MLPLGPRSFSGYQLLQEYFQLPEKFLFIELTNLRSHIAKQEHRELHIVVGIREMASDFSGRIKPEHVALHCVPAINLFRRQSRSNPCGSCIRRASSHQRSKPTTRLRNPGVLMNCPLTELAPLSIGRFFPFIIHHNASLILKTAGCTTL